MASIFTQESEMGNEDAACGNPCGQEPMGCSKCDKIGRSNQDPRDDFEEYDDFDFEIFTIECEEEYDDDMTDVEADADTLASAGYGTDEDYGCYGGDEW